MTPYDKLKETLTIMEQDFTEFSAPNSKLIIIEGVEDESFDERSADVVFDFNSDGNFHEITVE